MSCYMLLMATVTDIDGTKYLPNMVCRVERMATCNFQVFTTRAVERTVSTRSKN